MKAAKVWRIGILSVVVAVLGSMAVSQPHWLADNRFLANMMTHELVSILIVILTITLASVANIHLAITRIAANSRADPATVTAAANSVRREINTNAWTIFWAFLAALAVLIWKGAYPENVWIVATAHAVGLAVLVLNALVLHDIYQATFSLARADAGGT